MDRCSGKCPMAAVRCLPGKILCRTKNAGNWWATSASLRRTAPRSNKPSESDKTRARRARDFQQNSTAPGFPLLLDRSQCLRDFLHVRHDRDIVIFEPGDFSTLVDDGDGPAGDPFFREVDSEFIGYGAPRMKIGEERIGDPHFFGK